MDKEKAASILKDEIEHEMHHLEGLIAEPTAYLGLKKIITAFEVALTALQTETCEDAISRADMLDAVGHGTTYTSEELQKIIKGLSSVQPNAIRVQTPEGFLIAEAKGTLNDYPGIWISKDDKDSDDVLALIEYCTSNKKFLINGYCKDAGTPKVILDHESGRISELLMNDEWSTYDNLEDVEVADD